MEYNEIKQLMQYLENSSLSSLDISLPDGTKISIQKEIKEEPKNYTIKNQKTDINENNEHEIQKVEQSNDKENQKIVKSPMVGTFYLKPSPTAEAYTQVGKNIKKGDTLCIVEAMKLMNEIESEFDGKVAEILVKDGEQVEYGKPLFIIE